MGPVLAIVLVAVGLIALFLIFNGIRIVPQAENWIVERFGKFTGILKPGLNLINPLFSRIPIKFDIREQLIDMPRQSIITSDNATVDVNGVLFFKVMDPYKAFYGIENVKFAISNLSKTSIRSIMGRMALDETLSNREKINRELLAILDEATDAWGTKITRVEIQDITPPQDIADAMARQMKAERQRRATVLEAQADREAAIERAEGYKQAQILEAEARKEAANRDSEARERLSQAEANAINVVAVALKSTGGDPLTYLLGQEYVKGLTKLGESANSKFVVLPADIMNTLGNIFKK